MRFIDGEESEAASVDNEREHNAAENKGNVFILLVQRSSKCSKEEEEEEEEAQLRRQQCEREARGGDYSDSLALEPCREPVVWARRLFFAVGHLLSLHPVAAIAAGLALSLCSLGMLRMEMRDEIREGYAPDNARSWEETRAMRRFWNSSGEPQTSIVLIQSRSADASMLHRSHLWEAVQLQRHLLNEFKCLPHLEEAEAERMRWKMCGKQCRAMAELFEVYVRYLNESVERMAEGKSVQEALRGTNLSYPRALIDLSYLLIFRVPVVVRLEMLFFGVQLLDNNQTEHTLSREQLLTNIRSVDLLLLLIRSESAQKSRELAQCELAMADHVNKEYHSELLEVHMMGTEVLNREMMEDGRRTMPYFAAGFIVMFLFVAVNVVGTAHWHGQLNRWRAWIVAAAILCPVLAISTAYGILSLLGMRINSFLLILPYLVLGIGVDDGFLLVHKWDNTGHISDPRERLRFVLSQVGPSISITTLTNVGSFVVGCGMPTPEVRLFCAGASIALSVVFVLQLLIFCPVLQFTGTYEQQHEEIAEAKGGGKTKHSEALLLAKKKAEKAAEKNELLERLLLAYCRLLLRPWFVALLVTLLLLFWTLSLVGTASIRTRLDPSKILPRNSPLQKSSKLLDDVVWRNYLAVTVLVQTPLNVSDHDQLTQFWRMVDEFETVPQCKGPQFSLIWLRDYQQFVRANESSGMDLCELGEFLRHYSYQHWRPFIRWRGDLGNSSSCTTALTQFSLVVVYHRTGTWDIRIALMQRLRGIAERHSHLGLFKALVWEQNNMFVDQMLSLKGASVQTVLVTLCCMALICAFFIPNPFSVLIAVLSISSICLGVFGMLYWCGFDFNPVVMAALLMSIGLSVDFCTHVIYHFQFEWHEQFQQQDGSYARNPFASRADKIAFVLRSVAWPMCQSGLSTILCTCTLFGMHSYAANVFICTILLVCSLGLAHGVLVLPCLMATLPRRCTTIT